MGDFSITGFLKYASVKCSCDRHFGWVCPKCKKESAWKRGCPDVVKEAVDRKWVVYVVSYDIRIRDGMPSAFRVTLRELIPESLSTKFLPS